MNVDEAEPLSVLVQALDNVAENVADSVKQPKLAMTPIDLAPKRRRLACVSWQRWHADPV